MRTIGKRGTNVTDDVSPEAHEAVKPYMQELLRLAHSEGVHESRIPALAEKLQELEVAAFCAGRAEALGALDKE